MGQPSQTTACPGGSRALARRPPPWAGGCPQGELPCAAVGVVAIFVLAGRPRGGQAELAGATTSTGEDVTKVRGTGPLVGTADRVDNMLRLGNRYRGWGRVIAHVGGRRVNPVNRFGLTEKRWLWLGMEIPVRLGALQPAGLQIGWHGIPSMEECSRQRSHATQSGSSANCRSHPMYRAPAGSTARHEAGRSLKTPTKRLWA